MKIFVPHAEVSRGGGLQSLLTTEADRSVFRCTNGKPWGWGGAQPGALHQSQGFAGPVDVAQRTCFTARPGSRVCCDATQSYDPPVKAAPKGMVSSCLNSAWPAGCLSALTSCLS